RDAGQLRSFPTRRSSDLSSTTPRESVSMLELRTLPPSARFAFRCRPEAVEKAEAAFALALPRAACRATTAGDRAALWLGPDEWRSEEHTSELQSRENLVC